jgi:hypothetical protein
VNGFWRRGNATLIEMDRIACRERRDCDEAAPALMTGYRAIARLDYKRLAEYLGRSRPLRADRDLFIMARDVRL